LKQNHLMMLRFFFVSLGNNNTQHSTQVSSRNFTFHKYITDLPPSINSLSEQIILAADTNIIFNIHHVCTLIDNHITCLQLHHICAASTIWAFIILYILKKTLHREYFFRFISLLQHSGHLTTSKPNFSLI
jgi:hypothetical protein